MGEYKLTFHGCIGSQFVNEVSFGRFFSTVHAQPVGIPFFGHRETRQTWHGFGQIGQFYVCHFVQSLLVTEKLTLC